MGKESTHQYSEQETQRRFKKLVHAALNTPPKPLSEMRREKSKAKRHQSPAVRKSPKQK
jgi:hypothetical protein